MVLIPKAPLTRRSLLKGVLGGTIVTVGLPFLDVFLNSNGTALAATGAPLPVRFGTCFWGLGLNPGRWEPKTVGANYDCPPEIVALKDLRHKINVYSGMKTFLDGKPNVVHSSGVQASIQGSVVAGYGGGAPSIDSLIADTIGNRTRFHSIEVSCCGDRAQSQSRRGGVAMNPSEISPAALYTRLFGAEFVDPNAASFTPDPANLLRKSALSVVSEERLDFAKGLGAADKARLDEYFTSLRELEQQVDLELQRPAPLESCSVPKSVAETPVGPDIDTVRTNLKLFANLLAHAMACGQTRVINVSLSGSASTIRKAGGTQSHHEYTHEEPIDAEVGYQREVSWFAMQNMEMFATLLATLDGIKEGDRTLLDRSAIYACSDTGYAKLHGLDNMPMFTAGSAGGRLKTGIHVQASGDPVTRVGLTLQQAVGMSVSTWGTESQKTSKTITEVLV
jgi:Protein of unknown function (DUF1552)